MHLTLETDYAMRIVFCLAKNQRRMDAASISGEMRVTLRFSLKILGKLAGAGIVNSYKGIKGGYELAHPAEEITLRQVVEAIEGRSYAISRCIVPDGECSRDRWGCCAFQKVWRDISNEVNAHMDRVDFAQLVQDDEALRQGKKQEE